MVDLDPQGHTFTSLYPRKKINLCSFQQSSHGKHVAPIQHTQSQMRKKCGIFHTYMKSIKINHYMDGMGTLDKANLPKRCLFLWEGGSAENWPKPNSGRPKLRSYKLQTFSFWKYCKTQCFWIVCPNNALVKDTSTIQRPESWKTVSAHPGWLSFFPNTSSLIQKLEARYNIRSA